MKVKFETTLQIDSNKKERMICLDIKNDIERYNYLYSDCCTQHIERKIERDIWRKYRVCACRCREDGCGCWSSEITIVAVDITSENAVVHMIMTKRC